MNIDVKVFQLASLANLALPDVCNGLQILR